MLYFSLILNIGSWCRHLVVLEHQVLKIPAGLPVEAAATVSVNPCTAFRLLKDFEDLESGNSNLKTHYKKYIFILNK